MTKLPICAESSRFLQNDDTTFAPGVQAAGAFSKFLNSFFSAEFLGKHNEGCSLCIYACLSASASIAAGPASACAAEGNRSPTVRADGRFCVLFG
ncbi:MAG: hypothetical protein ACLR1P_05400 [Oscillospiraceae bacterium]